MDKVVISNPQVRTDITGVLGAANADRNDHYVIRRQNGSVYVVNDKLDGSVTVGNTTVMLRRDDKRTRISITDIEQFTWMNPE